MLPNAFIGQPQPPTQEELTAALGAGASKRWKQLLAALAKEHGLETCEWTSYSRKAGWAMRLKQGKRNIVYLTPSQGAFLASFALGEKAMEAARGFGFPQPVQEILAGARKYAEGAAVRIEVHSADDVEVVTTLAGIKIAH